MNVALNAVPSLDFEAGMRNVSDDASCVEPVTVIIAVMIYELFK